MSEAPRYAFVEAHNPHRLLAYLAGATSQADAPEAGVIVPRTGLGDARRQLDRLLQTREFDRERRVRAFTESQKY